MAISRCPGQQQDFPAVIEKATREQLTEYHHAFYAPAVDVPGHRGWRHPLEDEALGFLSDIPRATPKPRSKAKWGLGDRYTANVRPVTAEEEPQVHMVFAVPGMPASDPQRTALSVMTHVLGGGMSSRLFQTVRERNGLCYSIYSHHAGFDDTGLFAIATATRPKDAAQGDEPFLQGVPQDRREARRGRRAGGREVGDGRASASLN